jgi:hypothetical protein
LMMVLAPTSLGIAWLQAARVLVLSFAFLELLCSFFIGSAGCFPAALARCSA